MDRQKSVDSLLNLSGEAFVRALYHTLLNREPDVNSLQVALDNIINGFDKRDLLISTALSDEARAKAWKIDGLSDLLKQARRERIPVFGVLFRAKAIISRILTQTNKTELRMAYIESQVIYKLSRIENELSIIQAKLDKIESEYSVTLNSIDGKLDSKFNRPF